MSASILFELFNLTVSSPTGIATYARNLTKAARDMGYEVDGLFHTYRAIDRKDPLLAEVGFFDARNRTPSLITKYLELFVRRLIGAPGGFRPATLPLSGVVINPGDQSSTLGAFRNAYASRLFMDVSRYHFKRYGRCANCYPSVSPTIFHATQAIPIRVPSAANIYTVHDIVPIRLPYTTLDDKKFFLNMVRHLGKTADHIVTVSEASRRDLIEMCGVPEHNVTNTYQSVSFPESAVAQSDDDVADYISRAFNLDFRGYYLFYGALEPKKNVGRLIDAHVVSRTARPLVIAGGLGWEYEADLAQIEQHDTKGYRIIKDRVFPDQRIRRVGRLSLSQLVPLIRGARALLFPSLYEGFGLPVLEAMLLGTPVLTSNVASLAEIAFGAARLVDPFDITDIAKGIRELDQDDDLREELTQQGRVHVRKFSPEQYHRRLAAVYSKVGGVPPNEPGSKS